MDNLLPKIKNKFNFINDFFKINPHKHWAFLIYVFFSLVVILILFSFYLLYEIRNEQMFQVQIEQKGNQTLLKEDLLKNTTNIFDQKTRNEIDINTNFSAYNDPSL